MLKKLWLVVAASALVAGAQVHAEEVAVVEQEVREAVADLSAEEFKQAMDLAQAIQAGDVSLHDLDAIAQIQENRQKRSKIIKAAVLVAVSVAVAGTAGYLIWKKFGSSKDADTADTKGGKKGDKKDGDVAADAKKAREAADAKAEAVKEAKAAIKKARGAKKAEAQAAADKLEKEAAELEAAAVKAEKAAEEAVKKAEAEAKKAKDEATKATKAAKDAEDADHKHDGDCAHAKPARRKAAKK